MLLLMVPFTCWLEAGLAGREVGTLGAAVGASGRLTEEGCCCCCPVLLLLLLVDRLVELLLLLGAPEGTLVEATAGPDEGVLDVAEVLAGVGAGGEVLFGAGTLAAGAELVEGAVEVAPVPGTGVITTLPFTDLIST